MVVGPLNVAQKVFDGLVGLGLPGSLLWYLRDRRKNRAADSVAEGTVSAEIQTRDTAALDAHVAYVERAFETERKSMDRQIKSLEKEVRELRAEIHDKDRLIQELHDQVGELTTQMHALQEQLNRIPPKLPPPHPREKP